MRVEIFEKIVAILEKQLAIDRTMISAESLIGSDLGADSLDTAEIAMMIKDEFAYDLTDDDISNIKTVKNICEILESNCMEKK